jgi:hypothetical protein
VGAGAAAIALVLLGGTNARAATLVANWQMNETSGTKMIDATGKHPGTIKNVGLGSAGFAGTAYNFAGKPSYVSVSNAADLNPGTGAFTISLHLKFAKVPSSTVGDFDLIRKGLASTSGGSWKIEILRSGKALCNYRSPSNQGEISAGPNLADNKWHTISCARTATQVILTVDGTPYVLAKAVKGISNTSGVLVGAKNTTGEDQTTAILDEVTITAG